MLGHHIAAAGVIAEHAVGGNGIIVKIQQHKGHARLHRCGKVAAADLAHKDEAVHLAVYKEGGHIAAFFCLRQNDLHQHRDVLLGGAFKHRPVQIGIKGVLVEKTICHQNTDALAAGLCMRPGRGLIAHLLGNGRIFARISALTPSLPARPLETDTVLMPSRCAISAMRTAFAMFLTSFLLFILE